MKELLDSLTAQVLSFALLAGVVYLIYRRLYGDAGKLAAAIPSAADVVDSARKIGTGLPSAVGSWVRGENESSYITREQQTTLAAQQLAKKRASVGGL